MQIPERDVVSHVDILSSIMGDLLISRSTSYYEINQESKPQLLNFSRWLSHLSTLVGSPRKEELEDYARIYGQFPDDNGISR